MQNNYGVFYPYESFNVGQRFFFFNNLKDHVTTINSSNNKNGSQLASEVSATLNQNLPRLDPSTTEGMEQIKNVLAFLASTIEYERSQEQIYYQKYLSDADLPLELKQRFEKIFSSGDKPFDYIEFINLINILHDGIDKYKTILNYEVNRLEQLQEVIDEYLNNPEEHFTGYTTKAEGEDKGFYSNFNSFLSRRSYRTHGIKYKSVQGTSTLSNALQKQLVSAVTNLWQDKKWQQQVVELLNKLAFNEPINQSTMRVFSTMLLNETLPKMQDSIIEFLNAKKLFSSESNYSNVLIDVNNLKNVIKDAANDYVDKLTSGNDPSAALRFISTLKNQVNSNELALDNDSKRYLRVVDPVGIKKKNHEEIAVISDEVMKILSSLIKDKKQRPATNKKAIVEQFIQLYGDPKLIEFKEGKYNAKNAVELIKSYIPTMESVVEFHIAAKDNLVSEALAGGNRKYLQQFAGEFVIEKFETAGGYQKADTFGIVNEDVGRIVMSLNHSALERYFSSITQQITQSYMDAIEIQINPIKAGKEIFDEKKFRQELGFQAKEFSIEAETERRLIFLKKRCLELKKSMKNTATEDQIEKAITAMKSTIQISSTVKSYNKYNNHDGFHGGSLGGTVEHQLRNIYKMYQYGGVDLPDLEWLIFAVYNTGNNMLGAHLKEPLENILSSVAGMLLFDDAGEQALYIKSQLDQRIPSGSSRFLHLYHLNDFYFPSSYILQLTYNGLLKAYNLLETDAAKFMSLSSTQSTSNGARIHIINEVGTPSNGDTWQSFFDNNKDKVSVNIVFLAGLLDIIQILNESMK